MHNPCSSPYFKSESHQMKLALGFQRQILLVFLPGRKGKPFQTFSLIQNSKNLSSLWLKGKAVPGLGREDHSSVQQHSPPSRPHPTGLGPPIGRGINDAFLTQTVHVHRTVGSGSSLTESLITRSKSWAWHPRGPICFHLFHCLTIFSASHPIIVDAVGQRVIREVHKNGSVDPSHQREGRRKMEGRKGRTTERRTLQNLKSALPSCLRAYDHYLSI